MRTNRRTHCWAVPVVVALALLLAGCGTTPAATVPPAATQVPPTAVAVEPVPTEVPPTPLPAQPTPTPVPSGPVPGGSVSLAFTEDPNSLDAALGYNLPAWQSLMNLYRGLMIYEGDRAVPD